MKKVVLLVCAVFALSASCKKDKSQAPAYYITADIDGEPVSFNYNNLARLSAPTNTENNKLYIYGATEIGENGNAISLTASVKQAIAAGGTYTGSADDYQYVGIAYIKGPFSPTQDNEYISDFSDGGVAISVTSISDTEVKGTFRGQIALNSTVKRVTNGKFNLRFNQ